MKHSIKILVVGCGQMGASHARAYQKNDGFEIVGLVSRQSESRERLSGELGGISTFSSFEEGLTKTQPDAVSINTYPETHAEYTLQALDAGAHVFVEKPLAETVAQAEEIVRRAKEAGKKVVVGYILHHHPSWRRFVEVARTLGKPLVMRLNLNQQSFGKQWQIHKNLMDSMSPIVDCGVHYVDVMCRMAQAAPVKVSAIGARLADELNEGMYNYGQLQVQFDDGSVGWYEAGWGPMISETAHFVKDVIGPKGSVSILPESRGHSAALKKHTTANSLLIHRVDKVADDYCAEDERIDLSDEPGHQELCNREQQFFLDAILNDLDMSDHLSAAVNSLRIVLAADESCRTGKTVSL